MTTKPRRLPLALAAPPAAPLIALLLTALLAVFALTQGCASKPPPSPTTNPSASSAAAPAPEGASPTPATDGTTEGSEAVAPAPPMPEVQELEVPGETGDEEVAAGEATDEEIADDEVVATEPEETEPEEADHAATLEQSLEAYESSEVFWQQGEFEDAFAALDRAYELMASVPGNADPLIAQQKEDLRALISRRLVEIYASRQTAVGDLDRAIPVDINDDVKREIASFQGPERDFFLESYRRSGRFRPMIQEELHRAGLPEQLGWLPMVESGFKVRALSRARALGLWQFIASTGYRYGLERSSWVDERMDPLKSTRAAIGYLTDLHNLFGDWLTALAAYNCGERSVLRVIHDQPVSYFDQFWDLYARLPRETRRYVPRFLAVLAILGDPQSYGFELPDPMPALDAETVQVERPVELKALDKALGLDEGTLIALNPELRRGGTPDEPYTLRVPPETGETVLASLDRIPKWTPPSQRVSVHRVRRGETLSGVAARYGTSVRALMSLNRLRSANRIWPGQQLRVPDGRSHSVPRGHALAPGSEVVHRVRSGDSLWRLANQYGTTVEKIRRDNGLSGSSLRVGQQLHIRGPEATGGSDADSYTVQRGDTLGAIADRHGVPLDRLLRANRLSRRSTIYPGQTLTIPR